MLKPLNDVLTVRGLGGGISNHNVVLSKVNLVRLKIKSRKEMNEVGRIKGKRLREQQYKEEYTRALESKKEFDD